MEKREELLNEAKELGYNPPSNIGDETLENKVAELKAQKAKDNEVKAPENVESTETNEGAKNEATQTLGENEQDDEQLKAEQEAKAKAEQEKKDAEPKLNEDGFEAGKPVEEKDFFAHLAKLRNQK